MENKRILKIQLTVIEEANPIIFDLLSKITSRGVRPQRILSLIEKGVILEKLNTSAFNINNNDDRENTISDKIDCNDNDDSYEEILGID